MDLLDVPVQKRQFLISPPASPPIGWAPSEEDPPVMSEDHDIDGISDPRIPRIIFEEENLQITVSDFSDYGTDARLLALNNSLGARLAVPAGDIGFSQMPPPPSSSASLGGAADGAGSQEQAVGLNGSSVVGLGLGHGRGSLGGGLALMNGNARGGMLGGQPLSLSQMPPTRCPPRRGGHK
jgi:hypothetical protein